MNFFDEEFIFKAFQINQRRFTEQG